MPNRHTLHLVSRPSSSTYDGKCSCGKLEVRNRTNVDIRERHAEHLQAELGPGREVANA